MDSSILLSVIIPTFHSQHTLSTVLNSVLQQRYKNYEIIIVDGGSKDETVALAKTCLANHISFKIISEPDKGIYDAMNKGIKMASGEWLYFIGSDDYLFDNNVFSAVFKDDDDMNYDIIYGKVSSPVLGEKYTGEFDAFKITKWNICHQAIFYKKTVFKKYGYYNLKYKVWADWEFNLRWFIKKNIKIKYIDIVVAFFAPGGLSSMKVHDQVFRNDYQKLLVKYGYKKSKLERLFAQALREIKRKFF